MKYRHILFACFLLITTTSYAQSHKKRNDATDIDRENFFRIGFKGGININKIQGQLYKQGFNYNYQLGTFMQFNFSRRFGIQPEASLVQTTADYGNDPSDVFNDLFRDGTQKQAKLSYLEIPLLLNINVGESRHVKLQIGPAYGFLLNKSADTLTNTTVNFKKGDFSAIGGLWIQLPVINLGARYKYGFTNINNTSTIHQTWRNQAIQIFLGISF